jgi:hypothetical protein
MELENKLDNYIKKLELNSNDYNIPFNLNLIHYLFKSLTDITSTYDPNYRMYNAIQISLFSYAVSLNKYKLKNSDIKMLGFNNINKSYDANLDTLITEIKKLKHQRDFIPIDFCRIFDILDLILTSKLFFYLVDKLNEIKNHNYTNMFVESHNKINKEIERGNNKLKTEYELLIEYISLPNYIENKKFGSTILTTEKYLKLILNNKIEKFLIPLMLEECFVNKEKISDYLKIKIIFPIYLLIDFKYRDLLDSKDYTEKLLIDKLYNSIYRIKR